jgi:hypothetical protein
MGQAARSAQLRDRAGGADHPSHETDEAGAGQFRLASLGRVPRPIALASEDRFFAYSGATMG